MNKNILDEVLINKESKITSSNLYESIPWIEKYRPSTLDDLVLDNMTLNKIKRMIEEKDMPNIIITGIPGIGKTTTILCIAKALFGANYKKNILELNASDDRGIKAIQDTEHFCKKKMDLQNNNARHKIILLDEADNMTNKAQRLVNSLMEQYHKTTRFAFTCNNSSDIIESIQSRCIILRFCRLNNEQLIKRLEQICKIENVNYTKEALNMLAINSQGDMRNAINTLQLINSSYTNITIDNINKICDKPQPQLIKQLFLDCYKKNYVNAFKILYNIRNNGFSGADIIQSMINVLKSDFKELDESIKINYIEKVCKTSFIIAKGVDTNLQLSGLLSSLCLF